MPRIFDNIDWPLVAVMPSGKSGERSFQPAWGVTERIAMCDTTIKVFRAALIIFTMLAAAFDFSAAGDIGGATQFYVSPAGRDNWSGTLAEPNEAGTDGPFGTLAGARDAIRHVRAKGPLPGPVTVNVRGGKYFLKEPLAFEREDSGTRACPVTYRELFRRTAGCSGCGGRRLEGWRPFRDKILQCDVPDAREKGWRFRQLFYNGQPQTRARYPNCDAANPLYSGWLRVEGPGNRAAMCVSSIRPRQG